VFPHWNAPQTTNTLSVTSCNSQDKGQSIKFTGSGSNPGQLTHDNMCLDGTCADIKTGCVPLSFKPCTNSKSQQFVYKSDHSFSSVDNSGCLDLWDSGTGPEVGVFQCDGGSNQHWDVTGATYQTEAGGDRCLTTGAVKPMWVYSNAASVELVVNGVSQGKKAMPKLGHVEWSPDWVAGSIEVIAYDDKGAVLGKKTVETTGEPASILLEVEMGTEGIIADRQDAALIKASILDSTGRVVPTASNMITFSVSGEGHILGVGNGDPSSHEPDKGNTRSAFNGFARLLVQSTDQPGTIQVKATAPGLNPGATTVKTLPPKQPILSI